MLTVIAEIKAQPGQRDEVIAAFKQLLPSVLAEDGCGQYQPLTDVNGNTPDTLFMLEQWRDQAALAAHAQAPHMQAHHAATDHLISSVLIHVLDKPF